MKKIILFVAIAALIGVGIYLFANKEVAVAGSSSPYQFTTLTTNDIDNTVSATGTLSAVGTVEISTQVSGTIEDVLVDYNDTVKKNQLLAVMDKQTLRTSYLEAQASLEQSQAELKQSEFNYSTQKRMFDEGLSNQYDLLSAETSYKKAKSSVIAAQARLDKADLNLNTYADIRSPIAGMVLSRSIEPGQTVAASLSAPVLFEIAQDLKSMEILALVDESDIGQIKTGQTAEFTVEAYPDKKFNGTVQQVRLQPEVVSNVVNYTVVVNASNPDQLLLPGMTATVDFMVSNEKNVTSIESAALEVKPSTEMLQQMRAAFMASRANQGQDSTTTAGPANRSQRSGNGQATDGSIARLWYIDSNNSLGMLPVKKGASDGSFTQVTPLRELPAGARIIKAINGQSTSSSSRDNRPRGMRLF